MQAEIGDHALIGDGRAAALVARDGTIDWLCWPRFDSPALFASLVDPAAGRWTVTACDTHRVTRRYVDATNVVETRFDCADGRATLLDFMPVASEEEKRRGLFPEHELTRIVRCDRGTVEVAIDYLPRPRFNTRPVRLRRNSFGVELETAGALLTLAGTVPLEIEPDRRRASGRFTLREGETAAFSLAWSREAPAVLPMPYRAADALARTVRWWRAWSARLRYDGPWREQVLRSALTLKLLVYAPSGAIVAAPTTSLPERAGGDLNWDYRFCWLRDAAFTVRAFLALGCLDEAAAFGSWLVHATRLTLPELRVAYDVFGRDVPRERVLDLEGWRHSRPVRVGNDARHQPQLDVYGEVIAAHAALARAGVCPPDRDVQALLRALGEWVCDRWREPDHGIWEVRGKRRHWTHSKALGWVALDSLARLHEEGHLRALPKRLHEERAALRAEIDTRGWNPRLGAWTATFGGMSVDAALLQLPLLGYESPSSPRSGGTWRAIEHALSPRVGLLHRYAPDELSPGEGAFLACSFWAAELLALRGEEREARRWMEGALACANDVGLFGEETDPRTGAALGNFPQAYTHVGLVCAADAISRARRGIREAHP